MVSAQRHRKAKQSQRKNNEQKYDPTALWGSSAVLILQWKEAKRDGGSRNRQDGGRNHHQIRCEACASRLR